MKSITKRDIADIVLVWMTVSFLFMLLTSIITLGSTIIRDTSSTIINN